MGRLGSGNYCIVLIVFEHFVWGRAAKWVDTLRQSLTHSILTRVLNDLEIQSKLAAIQANHYQHHICLFSGVVPGHTSPQMCSPPSPFPSVVLCKWYFSSAGKGRFGKVMVASAYNIIPHFPTLNRVAVKMALTGRLVKRTANLIHVSVMHLLC